MAIGEYTYLAEEGLEDLADEIELKLGKSIANLKVTLQRDKPYVRFSYIGSLTSKDKQLLKQEVQKIVSQYEPIDEDDIFGEIEFDDFEKITEIIEDEQLEEQLE